MGKINLGNINKGLAQVKGLTDEMKNVAVPQNVPTNLIRPASFNPYSEDDDSETIRELASSIEASGLIHPLVVNEIIHGAETYYELISGERRFKAISQYLNWKTVPCSVYKGLDSDDAALKLHTANLSVREYTSAQKLKFYTNIADLLEHMKASGKYRGGIQKGIAEMLGISTHQVRKYKAITENLPEPDRKKVESGEVSVDAAYRKALHPNEPKKDSVPIEPVKLESKHTSTPEKKSLSVTKHVRDSNGDLPLPNQETIFTENDIDDTKEAAPIGYQRLTLERVNGIKTGYWSPASKEELVQRLAGFENAYPDGPKGV